MNEEDIGRLIDFIEDGLGLSLETWQAKALRAILASPEDRPTTDWAEAYEGGSSGALAAANPALGRVPWGRIEKRVPADFQGLLSEDETAQLNGDLRRMAEGRREAEAKSRDIPMS